MWRITEYIQQLHGDLRLCFLGSHPTKLQVAGPATAIVDGPRYLSYGFDISRDSAEKLVGASAAARHVNLAYSIQLFPGETVVARGILDQDMHS